MNKRENAHKSVRTSIFCLNFESFTAVSINYACSINVRTYNFVVKQRERPRAATRISGALKFGYYKGSTFTASELHLQEKNDGKF
jgi:hypothetical protein